MPSAGSLAATLRYLDAARRSAPPVSAAKAEAAGASERDAALRAIVRDSLRRSSRAFSRSKARSPATRAEFLTSDDDASPEMLRRAMVEPTPRPSFDADGSSFGDDSDATPCPAAALLSKPGIEAGPVDAASLVAAARRRDVLRSVQADFAQEERCRLDAVRSLRHAGAARPSHPPLPDAPPADPFADADAVVDHDANVVMSLRFSTDSAMGRLSALADARRSGALTNGHGANGHAAPGASPDAATARRDVARRAAVRRYVEASLNDAAPPAAPAQGSRSPRRSATVVVAPMEAPVPETVASPVAVRPSTEESRIRPTASKRARKARKAVARK